MIAPYLGVFLDGRGLSSEDIGELIAIMTVARLIAPNLWATFADKSGKGLQIIRLGSAIALLSFLLLLIAEGFWAIAAALSLSIGFWTSIVPQLEQLTLNEMQGDSSRYSRVRLWGSIGFILMSVVCGFLIDFIGTDVVLLCSIAMLASLFGVTLLLSNGKPNQDAFEAKGSIWQKVTSKTFLVFIVAMLLLQMSFGPYYSFFALFLRDLGYSGQETGWLIALGVLSEVVIFLYAGKLLQKTGIKLALILCLFATAVRWMLLAQFSQVLVLLLLSQLLHALSFAFAHTAAIQFIHQYFGARYQSRGQALYVSISFGLGGAIGSFFAGKLWMQGAGAQETWLAASAVALLGAVMVLLMQNVPKVKQL